MKSLRLISAGIFIGNALWSASVGNWSAVFLWGSFVALILFSELLPTPGV